MHSESSSHVAQSLLEVRDLRKHYKGSGGQTVTAAEDVSFRLEPGQATALVGESGSGKTTVARLVLRLEPADGGELLLDGTNVLETEAKRASLAYRARVQMVFQDPFGSLNPAHDVLHHLKRPLLRHKLANSSNVRDAALKLLEAVGLEPAEDFIRRSPYELSGGQRQRVAIARALAVDPDILVADEPTSMLDVSIRMGVLELLRDLKKTRKLAILLITHDLASARYLADRILVLFKGRVVEDGPSDDVVQRPAHPYTRRLLESIASPDRALTAERAPSENSSAGVPNHGCPFAQRCPDVHDPCLTDDPDPRLAEGRLVRCHLYKEN